MSYLDCVPPGSVLGPLLYIADLPDLLQNVLVGYADDSTLFCRIPHHRDMVSVAASWMMIWLWSTIGSVVGYVGIQARRGDAYFLFSYGWTLVPWPVILNSNLAFEKKVRAFAASASSRFGILLKTMSVFLGMSLLLLNGFDHLYSLWICDEVLFSSLDVRCHSHLLLLDCVVGRVNQLCCGSVSCDLWHRRIPTLGALDNHYRFFLRCQGLELVSFRPLLFRLVLDCGMGCMNLSLLVNAWVLLKLLSIAFFYKIDCPLFLRAFFFSGPKIVWGSFELIGSMPLLKFSQSVNCDFTSLCWTKKSKNVSYLGILRVNFIYDINLPV